MFNRGAGGTSGGSGSFLLGLVMMSGGGYLLLQSISVNSRFGFGTSLYSTGGVTGNMINITGGSILFPFMIGVGIIFYNSRNYLGWIIAAGSVIALVFGVISNIRFTMQHMSAFDLITILILAIGGFGLFIRSFKNGD